MAERLFLVLLAFTAYPVADMSERSIACSIVIARPLSQAVAKEASPNTARNVLVLLGWGQSIPKGGPQDIGERPVEVEAHGSRCRSQQADGFRASACRRWERGTAITA
jgi:hypothetical protein